MTVSDNPSDNEGLLPTFWVCSLSLLPQNKMLYSSSSNLYLLLLIVDILSNCLFLALSDFIVVMSPFSQIAAMPICLKSVVITNRNGGQNVQHNTQIAINQIILYVRVDYK